MLHQMLRPQNNGVYQRHHLHLCLYLTTFNVSIYDCVPPSELDRGHVLHFNPAFYAWLQI